jgi:tRNA(fMet)-specific endonuclease VapC
MTVGEPERSSFLALERPGKRLDDPDLRIVATVLAHEATLITGNTRHFQRVPGLRHENWLRP